MESANKPIITVRVEIHPGPVSPAQQTAWRRFWAKLIADTTHDRFKSKPNDVVKEGNSEKNKA